MIKNMKHRQSTLLAVLMLVSPMMAQVKTDIRTFNLAGPYAVTAPLALDTVDAQGQ
jgi:hypothetical protein